MRKPFALLAAFFAASLVAAACATAPLTDKEAFDQTRVIRGPSGAPRWIAGPMEKTAGGPALYQLRAMVESGRVSLYQLYVDSGDYAWRRLYRAGDGDDSLTFVPIMREGYDPADYGDFQDKTELWAVNLPRSYLNLKRATGLTVTAVGRNGNSQVVVPAAYVEGFLNKVDFLTSY